MVDYKHRLTQALTLAGRDEKDLQAHLGITYQAMKKLEKGTTKSLSAENNARAARFLDVDSFWLATGEGTPRPMQPWPFTLILPSQWAQMDADFRRQLENNAAGEWLRVQQRTGTSG